MGTRNLIKVIHKEKTVIAQYGQWDGYPEGQGLSIVRFFQQANIEEFKSKLKLIRFETEEDKKECEIFFSEIGCADGWMNKEQSGKFKEKYPLQSRDLGASVLWKILELEKEEILQDSSDFESDDFFCEWAYTINLDKMNLHITCGADKTFSLKYRPCENEFLKLFKTD